MKNLKKKLMSGTAPLLIIIANEKGGQGKSLTALAVADYAHLCGAPLGVAQIDNQSRLGRAIGRKVLTVEPIAGTARRDPAAEARTFTPLYSLLEKAGRSGANVLIDIGANQSHRFCHWAGLLDLQEDLSDWGFETIILVPFVAESEAIRQAGHTASMLLDRLPGTRLVLIENERDGRFADLHPASDTALTYRESIETLKLQAMVLTMSPVVAGSWRLFEASHSRLVTVAGMPVETVMKLTGLPRPEAKIARGDVAAWCGSFFSELDRALPWHVAGGGND